MFQRVFTKLSVLLLLLTTVTNAEGYWWSLASSSLKEAALQQIPDCKQLSSLTRNQQALCMKYGSMMKFVSEGASMAIEECQDKFKNNRWNCSTSKEGSIFGGIVKTGSRETAFISAISAAGVVVAVGKACKRDDVTMCGCGDDIRPNNLNARWQWGGCGDNTEFAYGFAREFVDAKERDNVRARSRRERARKHMNLHNNEAGRLLAITSTQLTCKCHGTSGSCNLKTCWNEMPNFDKIGQIIKNQYSQASEVQYLKRGNQLRPRDPDDKMDSKRLVFLESSPDYCVGSEKMEILGTSGRHCNKDSKGSDSCAVLCCGRKYTSTTRIVSRECNCKFKWCCQVECQTCVETITTSICD